MAEERANNGVRSLDPSTVSTITSFAAGYIDKDNEVIVGLQTDEVLRRAIKPFGGIKVVEKACRENGVEVDPKVKDILPIIAKRITMVYLMHILKRFVRSALWDF